MSRLRRAATALGLLVALGGVVTAALPSLAPAVGSATVLTALVGLAALALGGYAAYVRSARPPRRRRPLADRATPSPPPEATLAVTLDEVTGVPGPVETQARSATYLDVRTLAVDALVRRRGCSPANAGRLLADGEWTADPVAAALFTGDPPTRRDRLREWLTGRPTFERRTARALDAVARLDDGTDG
jgi:hypothetical protein